MADVKFQKGVNVKGYETKYGEILKIGVHLDEFEGQKGWINFDLKKGKSGKWYAEENNYKKDQTETVKDVFEGEEIINEIDEDEIPF